MDKEKIIELRDMFQELTDLANRMIVLEDKEKTKETKKEYEEVLERIIITLVKVNGFS